MTFSSKTLCALVALTLLSFGCGDDDGGTPDMSTPDMTTPDGDTPDMDAPDGDTPDGDTPDGDTPDGDTPDGDTPDMDTGAIAITANNMGASAYVLSSDTSGIVGSGEGNQTLTLVMGERYSIAVTNSRPHPFEFIVDGGSPGADMVLLSQTSSTASLEADADIDWDQDSVSGTVSFTVTASFVAMVDGYRCGVHSSSMRGAVAF